MKTVLVLDDRPSMIDEIAGELYAMGFTVMGARSYAEAVAAVRDRSRRGKSFDLIVSDFDLSNKLYNKHRWVDGLRFLRWCKKHRVKSKIIFHSTAFEPHKPLTRTIHGPIRWYARALGAQVQGKSVLMPSLRPKKAKAGKRGSRH